MILLRLAFFFIGLLIEGKGYNCQNVKHQVFLVSNLREMSNNFLFIFMSRKFLDSSASFNGVNSFAHRPYGTIFILNCILSCFRIVSGD